MKHLRHSALLATVFIIWISSATCFSAPDASCVGLSADNTESKVQVRNPAHWVKAGQGLTGANVLYHYEIDSFWNSQALNNIESIGISSLRFPGGELSDNYDWESHTLERPKGWPKEAKTAAGKALRLDFREFLAHAEKAQVSDIFFTVNLDGAFRAPGDLRENIELYAAKAARWVKAVRDAGYRVRYWEIGNEPNLRGSYPLTVEEYAYALKVYAAAMREADPSILIGAVGPAIVKGIGFGDRVGQRVLENLRSGNMQVHKVCREFGRNKCVDLLTQGMPPSKPAAWWPKLVEEAGDSFDFAVIHRYERWQKKGQGRSKFTPKLERLKSFLLQESGRNILVALTEWNTPNEKKHGRITELEHLLDVAVQLGNSAVGGVDFSHYWTLRTPTGYFKPLMTFEGDVTSAGSLFGLVGRMLRNADVAEQMGAQGVYILRAKQSDRHSFMIVNQGAHQASFSFGDMSLEKGIQVHQLLRDGDHGVSAVKSCTVNASLSTPAKFRSPARSISFLYFLR